MRRGPADSLATDGHSGFPRDPGHGADFHCLGPGGGIASTWGRLLFAGGRFRAPINVSTTRVEKARQLLGASLCSLWVDFPIHLVSLGIFSAAYLNSMGGELRFISVLGAKFPSLWKWFPFRLSPNAFKETGGARIAAGIPRRRCAK